MAISRKEAEKSVEDFNNYYDTLSPKSKDLFGGKATIDRLEKCFNCGGSYKDVCSDLMAPGVYTIQPIIRWDE